MPPSVALVGGGCKSSLFCQRAVGFYGDDVIMHDQENRPEVLYEDTCEPATFVLETIYKGEPRVVADGVAFPHPHERVVVNWRTTKSVEVLDDVGALYDKFGHDPRVMWWHNREILTEAEPTAVLR